MTTLKLWWLRATRNLNAVADDLGHRPAVIWVRTLPARLWAFMKRRPFRLWMTFMLAYVAGWMLGKSTDAPNMVAEIATVAIAVVMLFGHGFVSGRLESEHHKTVMRNESLETVNKHITDVVDKQRETINFMRDRMVEAATYPNSLLNGMANNHFINYPEGMFEQRWEENVNSWMWSTYISDGNDHLVVFSDPDQVKSMQGAVEGFAKLVEGPKELTK